MDSKVKTFKNVVSDLQISDENANNALGLELESDNSDLKSQKSAENASVAKAAKLFDFDDIQKPKSADMPQDNDCLIETACSLVYLDKQSNQLCIKKGLDLSKKDTLWGIQLETGEVIELCRQYRSYKESADIVEKLAYYEFTTVNLISENEMESLLASDVAALENDFNKTVETLAQYGIKADKFGGRCWLNERKDYEDLIKYAALTAKDFWIGQNNNIDVVSQQQDDFIDRIVLQRISPAVKAPYPVIYLFGNKLVADEYLRMEDLSKVFGAMLAPRMVVRFTSYDFADNMTQYDKDCALRFYGKTGYKSDKKLQELDTTDFNIRVEQTADIFEKYGIKVTTMIPCSAGGKRIGSYETFFF